MAEMIALDSIGKTDTSKILDESEEATKKIYQRKKSKLKVLFSSTEKVLEKDVSPHVNNLLIELNYCLSNLNCLVDDLMSSSVNDAKFYDHSMAKLKSASKQLSRVNHQIDNVRIYLALKSKQNTARIFHTGKKIRRHSLHDLTDDSITLTHYTRNHSVTGATAVTGTMVAQGPGENMHSQVNRGEECPEPVPSHLHNNNNNNNERVTTVRSEDSRNENDSNRNERATIITFSDGYPHFYRSMPLKRTLRRMQEASAAPLIGGYLFDYTCCFRTNIIIISLIVLAGIAFVLLRTLLEWSKLL